jgi:ubiquinone/menaquinone biosynthesis C-methylase UbiE
MKKLLSWFTGLALGGALCAQVATDANSGYQTQQGRQSVAKGLANPERDNTQKPQVLIREMGIEPGMTVADIGTGVGYMLPFLSRRVGASGRVIAEDIFDDFLNAAQQRVAEMTLTNVAFVKGTESDPNLPDGKVDVALVLDAYHHFNYPEKMLAAIHRALTPKGRLVIVEYYKRETSMGGRALTHIRLDMPDLIKEVETNHFHLLEEKEHIRNVQYMLILDKSDK